MVHFVSLIIHFLRFPYTFVAILFVYVLFIIEIVHVLNVQRQTGFTWTVRLCNVRFWVQLLKMIHSEMMFYVTGRFTT